MNVQIIELCKNFTIFFRPLYTEFSSLEIWEELTFMPLSTTYYELREGHLLYDDPLG